MLKGDRNGLKIQVRRAEPPALTENDRGCFLPDLTRLTTLRCGETRRPTILSARIEVAHAKLLSEQFV